jgi:hypothetical protein
VATGTYAPDPDLRVTDPNGVPVPGGLVWTYIAGTTTPTPTYTDVGLTVANSNPIVAGSDGRFVAFLAGGISYKFVYEMPATPPAHGAAIITRDNILAVTTITPGSGGGIIQVTSLTGTVNDLVLVPGCSVLMCRNNGDLTITGMAGGVPGQRVTLVANSQGSVFLSHLNTGSLAANRLLNWVTSGVTPLGIGPAYSGGVATYVYDDAFTRWNLVTHEQATWLPVTFNAANFGASGGTWTVASGNVAARYRLSGRTLHLNYVINSSTITGTPGALTIVIPNGYQLANGTFDAYTPARCIDAGVTTGMLSLASVGTLSIFTGPAGSGWTAGSGRQVEFFKMVEVQ